eukprot:CAMPEP_0174706176 /NCGR_PEP_ID=MMETSP1094-20130205/9120_1 /TAXON_ID=156173 /ORGANISM="Chrysochromulina brevifilum, Strain UTEX LB 985" /LENGTH=161 /DNA_ID=CAMNT_0015904411 /DNA_START=529 /DNA_END=1015 /DNA_ORIENTATION=+
MLRGTLVAATLVQHNATAADRDRIIAEELCQTFELVVDRAGGRAKTCIPFHRAATIRPIVQPRPHSLRPAVKICQQPFALLVDIEADFAEIALRRLPSWYRQQVLLQKRFLADASSRATWVLQICSVKVRTEDQLHVNAQEARQAVDRVLQLEGLTECRCH